MVAAMIRSRQGYVFPTLTFSLPYGKLHWTQVSSRMLSDRCGVFLCQYVFIHTFDKNVTVRSEIITMISVTIQTDPKSTVNSPKSEHEQQQASVAPVHSHALTHTQRSQALSSDVTQGLPDGLSGPQKRNDQRKKLGLLNAPVPCQRLREDRTRNTGHFLGTKLHRQ